MIVYGRWYDRLHTYVEGAAGQAWYLGLARIYTWSIPELARLADPRDRVFALTVVATPAQSQSRRLWRFLTLYILPFVIGMLLGGWLAAFLLPPRRYLVLEVIILWAGGMLGFIVAGAAQHLWNLKRNRLAVFQLLANLDESICPFCGYDLRGHLPEALEEDITCPECGRRVPRLTPAAQDRSNRDPLAAAHERTARLHRD